MYDDDSLETNSIYRSREEQEKVKRRQINKEKRRE